MKNTHTQTTILQSPGSLAKTIQRYEHAFPLSRENPNKNKSGYSRGICLKNYNSIVHRLKVWSNFCFVAEFWWTLLLWCLQHRKTSVDYLHDDSFSEHVGFVMWLFIFKEEFKSTSIRVAYINRNKLPDCWGLKLEIIERSGIFSSSHHLFC